MEDLMNASVTDLLGGRLGAGDRHPGHPKFPPPPMRKSSQVEDFSLKKMLVNGEPVF
jgi:hypothetical protein